MRIIRHRSVEAPTLSLPLQSILHVAPRFIPKNPCAFVLFPCFKPSTPPTSWSSTPSSSGPSRLIAYCSQTHQTLPVNLKCMELLQQECSLGLCAFACAGSIAPQFPSLLPHCKPHLILAKVHFRAAFSGLVKCSSLCPSFGYLFQPIVWFCLFVCLCVCSPHRVWTPQCLH